MIVCSSIGVVCSMSELAVIAVHRQWDRHAHVGIYLAEIVASCQLLHNTGMNSGRSTVGWWGRSTVGWWGGVQWDGGGGVQWDGGGGVQWDGGEEYSEMVGRSTVGWWGGVQWDGGEEYSGMVGRSTVGWWREHWDGILYT